MASAQKILTHQWFSKIDVESSDETASFCNEHPLNTQVYNSTNIILQNLNKNKKTMTWES